MPRGNSTVIQSQGATATLNGRAAEDAISDMLTRKGLFFSRRQPVGKGIYGTPIFADFCIRGAPVSPDGLIIEVKWQDSGGSVEEKFPYLVANIARYPYPTIIVLDGGGFRAGAQRWLAAQAGHGNLLHVFTIGEFLSWTLRSL